MKVWSIRNKKIKIHLGTIGISQPVMHDFPLRTHFRPWWDSVSIARSSSVMHSTFCFSRKQDGCLSHCRLAKQDLLAQTLRIKITGVAFPLVQSTPCYFYIASNAGHSLSSLPSGQCRMMVPKCSLMAVYRREAEDGGGGVERVLDGKSRACVSILHLVPVSYIILRKYLQARSQFPHLVMRGLL